MWRAIGSMAPHAGTGVGRWTMSIQMDTARSLLHLSPNVFASERRLRRTLRLPRPDAPVPWWLRRQCAVERLDGLGCPVLRLHPRRPSGTHIVYLHGGSFVFPLIVPHWWIIAALIERTGAVVTVPSYALAPESTFDDSIGALDATVQHTLADPAANKVIFAGDSAGEICPSCRPCAAEAAQARSQRRSFCSPRRWTWHWPSQPRGFRTRRSNPGRAGCACHWPMVGRRTLAGRSHDQPPAWRPARSAADDCAARRLRHPATRCGQVRRQGQRSRHRHRP